jgi:hypothetical protein
MGRLYNLLDINDLYKCRQLGLEENKRICVRRRRRL